MGKRFTVLWVAVMAFVLLAGIFAMVIVGAETPGTKIETKGVAENCLKCHDYEKIRKDTAEFKTPEGDTSTPHKYIPHKKKADSPEGETTSTPDEAKAIIPDCTECHTEHSFPAEKDKIVKPKSIQFCYTSCHHMNNLMACSTCHN